MGGDDDARPTWIPHRPLRCRAGAKPALDPTPEPGRPALHPRREVGPGGAAGMRVAGREPTPGAAIRGRQRVTATERGERGPPPLRPDRDPAGPGQLDQGPDPRPPGSAPSMASSLRNPGLGRPGY